MDRPNTVQMILEELTDVGIQARSGQCGRVGDSGRGGIQRALRVT